MRTWCCESRTAPLDLKSNHFYTVSDQPSLNPYQHHLPSEFWFSGQGVRSGGFIASATLASRTRVVSRLGAAHQDPLCHSRRWREVSWGVSFDPPPYLPPWAIVPTNPGA